MPHWLTGSQDTTNLGCTPLSQPRGSHISSNLTHTEAKAAEPGRWQRLLGEPTLHFIVLGGLLFLAYAWLAPSPPRPEAPAIVVRAGKVESLVAGWTEEWQRQPTEAERNELIEDEVRSEVLAHEAVARGLDRNDDAIRTLLREKMELIAENSAVIAEPSEADLQAYYAAHLREFGGSATVTFTQVMLDPGRRGTAVAEDAAAALAQLRAGADPTMLGDSSELETDYVDLPQEQVESMFGPEFAQQLAAQEPGQWAGPIASPLGVHLVRLRARGEVAPQPLDEVRDVVREEWHMARLQEARDEAYRTLRARYRITVEPVEPRTAAMTATGAAPQ